VKTLQRILLPILVLTAWASAQESAALAKTRAKLETGAEPVKIVCFGDSVTGLYYHTGGRRTYTDMLGIALERACPKAEVITVNAGISGHTTANALTRIEKDVLAHKPDLVTVMFGLNDMVKIADIETYRKNLVEIIRQCRAIDAEVVLCTPNSVITTGARSKDKLERYCEAIREVAAENRVPLCDSFAAFEELREADPLAWRLTLSDEIHPNMAGHKAIAEQLTKTISGKPFSLADVGPLQPALDKTQQLLADGKPVKILVMPPYGQLFEHALRQKNSDANLEIVSWPIEGLTLREVEKDASKRVRKLKPNLVVIAIPRAAYADSTDQEKFIRSYHWTACYSLSFGRSEWDCVVVHPSVFEPDSPDPETDDLIRQIVASHDLTLIDRPAGDRRGVGEILAEWLKRQ
jgi:lysophospholipase L1-like esterase